MQLSVYKVYDLCDILVILTCPDAHGQAGVLQGYRSAHNVYVPFNNVYFYMGTHNGIIEYILIVVIFFDNNINGDVSI